MPTVVTATTPYCNAAKLTQFKDWRVLADWAKDTAGPKPTMAALMDPTDPAGANVLRALMAASGDVESAALRGGRYTVEDLQALTGNTRAELESLVGWVAVGLLAGRRGTGEAGRIPEVMAAREKIEALRVGESVFGLQAQIDAGKGPTVVDMTLPTANSQPTTSELARGYFGVRGRNPYRGC